MQGKDIYTSATLAHLTRRIASWVGTFGITGVQAAEAHNYMDKVPSSS